ncbi:low specificity L-threonine aldolase [Hoeflea sp. TYP-13]|uniref:low specificity L-threonine aldolase n=1 Tax=Hoeflea sp. TYP-13 TaxID=3230023 RepID=UPI0034C6D6CA
MHFSSDNWAGAHPLIAESLTRHASGFAAAYGGSDLDKKIEAKFNEIFEREVAVFFVGTGTAANSLAMASVSRPGGVAFCHREAHLIADEGGAPEFLGQGIRLAGVDGAYGKIDPQELEAAIGRVPPEFVHAGQPMAVSISQSTEIGTVYEHGEIEAVAEICRKHGLSLHMDGARFANAMAGLGSSPAEMSWRRGVDVLSFGGTKNGCWCAEALVVFDPEKAKDLPFIRKRSAHLFSKTRFIAAQFEAYFEDDLWMQVAAHANNMSSRLQEIIRASDNARLAWDSQANEVFAIMRRDRFDMLIEKGVRFYEWHTPNFASSLVGDDELITRLVTGFATTEDHVLGFAESLE